MKKQHAQIAIPTALLVPLLLFVAHLAWQTYTKVELHDWLLKYHGLDRVNGPTP